jgi:predicted ATPase/class 3 adenylate cyclase
MRPLPAGFVVFVFTDIEGSTRLQQRVGTVYSELIAEHDRLLSREIEQYGGVVLNSMGDGLFAVFESVTAAVAASGSIQRRVRTHGWPGGATLRVRVGLHGATTSPVGDRYISLDVNKAARVADAAYGGQVLATASIVDMATEGDLGEWRRLGEYRLKDFDDPVELFSLHLPGVSDDAAGARAEPINIHNVPAIATAFIGRESEVAAIVASLSTDTRLLTLLGPGGVGKTRLAYEVARAATPSFSGGAWVVLLANADGGDLVERTLRSLGVPERPQVSSRQLLMEVLARRRLLLLFDNCEHVIDDVADLVAELRASAPAVAILATSREPLRVAGERQWTVDPLSADQAVDMFTARVQERHPQMEFDEPVRDSIARVCELVDRIPLAIELAAARLSYVSIEELEESLGVRPSWLTSDERGMEGRQSSLHNLIGWSYQLTSPTAQQLLRQLSVFRSAVSRSQIRQVCAAEGAGSIDDVLDELVSKSLVTRAGDGRQFRVLSMIREYAASLLTAAEAAKASAGHVRLHVRLSDDARAGCEGPEPAKSLEWIGEHYDDFVVAMQFAHVDEDGDVLARIASGLFPYFKMAGRLNEGRRWLELAGQHATDAALGATAESEAGILALSQGYVEAAFLRCSSALDRLSVTGDGERLAMAQLHLAETLGARRDLPGARGGYTLALHRTSNDLLRARALKGLGAIALAEGDSDSAARLFADAYRHAELAGSTRYLAITKANLALLELQRQKYAAAEGLLVETIDVLRQIDRNTLPDACSLLAQLYDITGKPDLALHWDREARQAADAVGMSHAMLMRAPA